MSALDDYRKLVTETYPPFHAVETQFVKEYADDAVAELEAENERAWGERDHYLGELMERNTQLKKAESERDALRDRRLPCREAEVAQARYEAAEAGRDKLRCCGNCAESHDIDNDFMCECWPDMNEAKSEDDKPTDVCPGDPCHFTPSCWRPRDGADR